MDSDTKKKLDRLEHILHRNRVTGRRFVKKLRRGYVVGLITASTKLSKEDITPEMIEIKRELIQFNRLEKELNNVINR